MVLSYHQSLTKWFHSQPEKKEILKPWNSQSREDYLYQINYGYLIIAYGYNRGREIKQKKILTSFHKHIMNNIVYLVLMNPSNLNEFPSFMNWCKNSLGFCHNICNDMVFLQNGSSHVSLHFEIGKNEFEWISFLHELM